MLYVIFNLILDNNIYCWYLYFTNYFSILSHLYDIYMTILNYDHNYEYEYLYSFVVFY